MGGSRSIEFSRLVERTSHTYCLTRQRGHTEWPANRKIVRAANGNLLGVTDAGAKNVGALSLQLG